MQRILFDARWITPGMTGVGRVALETLRAIPARMRSSLGVIVTDECPALADLDGFRIHRTRIGLTRHPATEAYEQVAIPFLCYRHGYKAFVSFEGRVPVFHPGIRTYGYLHDATFISNWRDHGLKYSLLLWIHLAVMRAFATGIITVSEAARGRIVERARIRPRRIAVVHNADSRLDTVAPAAPSFRADRRPYVLAVGMSNPRKGFPVLAKAFTRFNRDGSFELVATGSPEPLARMHREAGEDPDIRIAGFVTDGELRHLYEHAACLAYPSREEGFGIPLLDAALAGIPVACSDLDVFHEVLGDDATWFDPDDAESVAQALARATAPGAPRADARALRRKFSWEQSALRLLALAGGKPAA